MLLPCLNPCLNSFQFGHSVMSDSLRPHGLQHNRPPCPSPTPRVYSNSMSIELVMPSNYLILCCPLFLLPSIFSSIRVSSNESVLCIRWPTASASILPMNIQDWFPLGWISWTQGILKSLLQHHSSKASILWCSALFMVQLSRPYITTWKNWSFD